MIDTYISWEQLRPIIGNKSRSTVWRWYKAGLFPQPRQIGPGSVAWLASEVNEWIAARAEGEDKGTRHAS